VACLPACSSIAGEAAQYSEMIGSGRRHKVGGNFTWVVMLGPDPRQGVRADVCLLVLCPWQNGSVDIALVQVQGHGAVVPQYSPVPVAS
jgi:hypothetical protein